MYPQQNKLFLNNNQHKISSSFSQKSKRSGNIDVKNFDDTPLNTQK